LLIGALLEVMLTLLLPSLVEAGCIAVTQALMHVTAAWVLICAGAGDLRVVPPSQGDGAAIG
jgi:hypothetical protein